MSVTVTRAVVPDGGTRALHGRRDVRRYFSDRLPVPDKGKPADQPKWVNRRAASGRADSGTRPNSAIRLPPIRAISAVIRSRNDAVQNGERARPGRCRRPPRRRPWHWDQRTDGFVPPRTVRREGAPNYSRGGCAHHKTSCIVPAKRCGKQCPFGAARETPGRIGFDAPKVSGAVPRDCCGKLGRLKMFQWQPSPRPRPDSGISVSIRGGTRRHFKGKSATPVFFNGSLSPGRNGM
jgi:hypothetical protein